MEISTDRALSLGGLPYYTFMLVCRYKPITRKVRPVTTNMPDLSAQTLKPIVLPPVCPLPTHPPPRSEFKHSERLTLKHLEPSSQTSLLILIYSRQPPKYSYVF